MLTLWETSSVTSSIKSTHNTCLRVLRTDSHTPWTAQTWCSLATRQLMVRTSSKTPLIAEWIVLYREHSQIRTTESLPSLRSSTCRQKFFLSSRSQPLLTTTTCIPIVMAPTSSTMRAVQCVGTTSTPWWPSNGPTMTMTTPKTICPIWQATHSQALNWARTVTARLNHGVALSRASIIITRNTTSTMRVMHRALITAIIKAWPTTGPKAISRIMLTASCWMLSRA